MADNKTDYILGCGMGGACYFAAKKCKSAFNGRVIGKYLKNFSEKENANFKDFIFDGFEKSGLKDSGVRLIDINTNNKDVIIKDFWDSFEKNDKISLRKNSSAGENLSKALVYTSEGRMAFFHPASKKIFINIDKSSSAAFHEMGHAVIVNGKNKFLKGMTAIRHNFVKIPLVFLAIGLLKNKKADGEKPKGPLDETATLVKNNAGKLSFIVMLPTLIDEGFATIYGTKIAKKVLSPEQMKKLNKVNMLAWSTYLISALATSGGVALGINIRDKIVHRNNLQNKNNPQKFMFHKHFNDFAS